MSNDMKYVNTGELSKEALKKGEHTTDINELGKQVTSTYEEACIICYERGKKLFDGDFYIHIFNRKERLVQNLIRNKFICQETCPTPVYDQIVYHYSKLDDKIDLLWAIPSKQDSERLKINALSLTDDEKDNLRYVLDYDDGTLLWRCKKLNNEDKLKSDIILKVMDEQ